MQAESSSYKDNYKSLISKAFIEPIRSVAVVDDEYPTLERLLENIPHIAGEEEVNSIHEKKETEMVPKEEVEVETKEFNNPWGAINVSRLKEIINLCHSDSRSWVVDVFDGKIPEEKRDSLFKSMNHSDLLFLDYHLEGEEDEGALSRQILKKLADNNHYNLVIVHTKGNSGDIRTVFTDILLDFLIEPVLQAPKEDKEKINSTIESWLTDIGNESSPISNELAEKLDDLSLLIACELGYQKIFKDDNNIMSLSKQSTIDFAKEQSLIASDIFWWKLNDQLSNSQISFSSKDYLIQSWNYDEDVNWIALGKVFITIISKHEDGDDIGALPQKLERALFASKPSPMFLLMAKMRYEIDETGVEEAYKILEDNYLQAGLLFQDLEKKFHEDDSSIHKLVHDQYINKLVIERQWLQLAEATKKSLNSFTHSLRDTVQELGPPEKVITHFFGSHMNQDKHKIEARLKLNCYACSQPVNNSHLITGQIIHIEKDTRIENDTHNANATDYWVCLTPVCDLVPEQKTNGLHGRLGSKNMPFKAVRLLNPGSINNALKKATNNNFIFVYINGKVEAFQIPLPPEIPEWEQMFALDSGRLDDEGSITIRRVHLLPENGELGLSDKISTSVVAELRYEYALNYLQILGSSLSRIGLNFTSKLWGN